MPVEVHIVTPEREVWSGDADLLIARGVDGEVGIQAGHIPLLVQLGIGPLRIRRDGEDVVAVIDGGFLHVATDQGVTRADVLATEAELMDDIDLEAARRRAAQLEEQIRSRADVALHAELAAAKAELAKAQARIGLHS